MTTISYSSFESTSVSLQIGGSFGFSGGFGGGPSNREDGFRSDRPEGFGRFDRSERFARFGSERAQEARENFRSRFEDTVENVEDAAVIIDQLEAFASALRDGGISDAIAAYRETGEQAQLAIAAQEAEEEPDSDAETAQPASDADIDAVEQAIENVEEVATAVDAAEEVEEAVATTTSVVETSEASLSIEQDEDGLSIEASSSSSTVTTTTSEAAEPVVEPITVEEPAAALLEEAVEEESAPVSDEELVGDILPAQSDLSGLIGSILEALESGIEGFEATYTQSIVTDGLTAETSSTLSIQATSEGLTASLLSSSTINTEEGSSSFLSELTFTVSDDAVSFSEIVFETSQAQVGNATVTNTSYQATSAYATLSDGQSTSDALTELVSAA